MQILRNIGKTNGEVAEIMNCDKSTVKRRLKAFKIQKKILDKPKPFRPSLLTGELAENPVALLEENRQRTSGELKFILTKRNPGFSTSEKDYEAER